LSLVSKSRIGSNSMDASKLRDASRSRDVSKIRKASSWVDAINSRDTSNSIPKQCQRKKLICVKTLTKLPELTVPVEGSTIHVQNILYVRTSRHSARVGTHTLNEGLT
jgi:hypothetical protein